MARKYTPREMREIVDKINKYVDSTELPTVCEFCASNNIRRQRLYEVEYFSDALKRLMEKKEAEIELGGLKGKYNATLCVFALKQMGWRDTPIETGNISNVIIVNDVPKDGAEYRKEGEKDNA